MYWLVYSLGQGDGCGVEREDGVLVGEGGSYLSEKGYSLIHG